jgi:hypothetical protein
MAYDFDAVIAEATGEPFEFILGGETFRMASPEAVDWKVAVDAETSGAEGTKVFLAELLGDDFGRFSKHRVPANKLADLLAECQKHYGVTQGESSASTGS